MDRFLNRHVVITLETGIGIKGVPTLWNDDEVVVSYPDSDNYTVIFNPSENIMMVSVYDIEELEPHVEYAEEYQEPIVEPDEPELDHFEPDPGLRALKLADLHLKKKGALKDMLNNHFKNNRVARMPQAPVYDSPNLTK